MSTPVGIAASSPLDRILGRAEDYGLVQPKGPEKPELCSETVKSLEKLLELRIRLSSQQQVLEERKVALSCEMGALMPEIVKNKVLLTLDDMSVNMGQFLDHVEQVLEKKELVTSYLQTPFSSDHLLVEAGHQSNMLQLLQSVSSFLEQSPATLKTMDWAFQFKSTDAQLERKLWTLSSVAARCQRYHDALARMVELYRELL